MYAIILSEDKQMKYNLQCKQVWETSVDLLA